MYVSKAVYYNFICKKIYNIEGEFLWKRCYFYW